MITKLKALYQRVKANKLGAVAVRVVAGGVVAFVAEFVKAETDAQLLTPAHYLDLSIWHATVDASVAAGIGAVLLAVQSILWTFAAGAPQLSKSARQAFVQRRVALGIAGEHETV